MQTQNLELQDILDACIKNALTSIYKTRIGKVVSFDANKQEANIELVNIPFKLLETGKKIEYPAMQLVGVPYASYSGKFGRLTFPVAVNDFVEVHFLDRDITNWLLSGETKIPASEKIHDKNSCFFTLQSPNPYNALLSNFDNISIHIESDLGAKAKFNSNVEIESKAGSKMEVASKVALQSTNGAKIEISNKVKIENTLANLKTTLNDFAEAIKNVKILNPITSVYDLPVDNATILLIEKFKLDINNLLE